MRDGSIFYKFIKEGCFNRTNIDNLEKSISINDKQLIKKTFIVINDETKFLDLSLLPLDVIKNSIQLLHALCDTAEFSEEDVVINRKRIKKSREALLKQAKKLNNESIIEIANSLDEIILDKGIELEDLSKLLKELIVKKEDFNIIKRLLNTNKGVLLMDNNELFDYTFNKAIESIIEENPDIYYYISLLKIFYSSKIIKETYLNKLQELENNKSEFIDELFDIVNGIKRETSTNRIINKYCILKDLKSINIITPSIITLDDYSISIDDEDTKFREDAISIQKSFNNYVVTINITDPSFAVKPDSIIDYQAKNNFSTTYLNKTTSRVFPKSLEKEFSLDKGKNRNVISMHITLDNQGNIVNYYIEKNVIQVTKNLNYKYCDELIDKGNNDLAYKLNLLYELACLLRKRNYKKYEYWKKKEEGSIDKKINVSSKSDIIVNELMVLYNYLIAKLASQEKIPYVYRIQNNVYLNTMINDLNIEVDNQAKKVLDSLYLKSKYSNIPGFHYGLDLEVYSHSTCGGRKYPDLYNQFLLHMFYFHDLEFNFEDNKHIETIDYFNQRSIDLSLMEADYSRALKLRKD